MFSAGALLIAFFVQVSKFARLVEEKPNSQLSIKKVNTKAKCRCPVEVIANISLFDTRIFRGNVIPFLHKNVAFVILNEVKDLRFFASLRMTVYALLSERIGIR